MTFIVCIEKGIILSSYWPTGILSALISISTNLPSSEIVEFNFEREKQDSIKNIDFILRHNNDYSFANIFLISELISSENQIQVDTLEFKLAESNGKWLGETKISVVEHKLPYKTDFILKKGEAFKLKVKTSMRLNNEINEIENLEGVLNFGLLIE